MKLNLVVVSGSTLGRPIEGMERVIRTGRRYFGRAGWTSRGVGVDR